MKKKIVSVIGARPQFIKHAPLVLQLVKYFEVVTIHTGQHYDKRMSDVFFSELSINKPDYMLNVGSHTHGKQTSIMLEKIEGILLQEEPDAMVVYGDTNSTLAGALAAVKLKIPIIHIEAGLRSFNRDMPEEINRIITDQLSSILFSPTQEAIENLKSENIKKNVFLCGDLMCDMVHLARLTMILEENILDDYYLATIHRPYNTDIKERMTRILKALNELDYRVIFPIHPRTKGYIERFGLDIVNYPNIEFTEPISYFDLIRLQHHSKGIITDSGGIQKEAYILRKKCVTIRTETEWNETLNGGWNTLLYNEIESLQEVLLKESQIKLYNDGIYGTGEAAHEISNILKNIL